MKVKLAADRLLAKGTITKEEHGQLEKLAAVGVPAITSGVKAASTLMGSTPAGKAATWFLGNVLLPGAVFGGTALLGKELIVDPLIELNKMQKSFDLMKQKVPILQEQDEDTVKDYFSVIKQYSPRAASNPLVAGALVNKMIQFGGVDHKLVQDLASIQEGSPSTGFLQTALSPVGKTMFSDVKLKDDDDSTNTKKKP